VSDFVVITGLSGAGRSQAADILEDLGFFVIDNLPPSLIPKVSELAQAPGTSIAKVVLVVGTGPYHSEVLPALTALRRQGLRLRIAFLEASTDVLVRRYESTRRRHPLSAADQSLADSIEEERRVLQPVKAEADVVIDTSDLNVHQLRTRVLDLFAAEAPAGGMQTTITSFGYKHGLPLDTDLVIDCRFLPNPHWVEELRPLTGLDEPVRDYVLGQPLTASSPRSTSCWPCCCRPTWPRASRTSPSRSAAPAVGTGPSPSPSRWPARCGRRASTCGSPIETSIADRRAGAGGTADPGSRCSWRQRPRSDRMEGALRQWRPQEATPQ
jgi:UPF0042 nucleotide-binding protein